MAKLGILFRKVLKGRRVKLDQWDRQVLLGQRELQALKVLRVKLELQDLLVQQEPLAPLELTALRLRYHSELSRLDRLDRQLSSQ